MEQIDTQLQGQYLTKIKSAEAELKSYDQLYLQERQDRVKKFADLVEEARFQSDLSVKEIASHLGKSRQALNKTLISAYGVRHPDKAKAGRMGHIND